jgi:hypothetical protein
MIESIHALSLRDLAPDTLPTRIVVMPDTGCEFSPSCLRCPRAQCIEDMDPVARGRLTREARKGAQAVRIASGAASRAVLEIPHARDAGGTGTPHGGGGSAIHGES